MLQGGSDQKTPLEDEPEDEEVSSDQREISPCPVRWNNEERGNSC